MKDQANPRQKLYDVLNTLISSDRPFKMTISKNRSKQDLLKNVYVKTVGEGKPSKYVMTYAYKTHDDTKTVKGTELILNTESLLKNQFLNISVFTSGIEYILVQNLKGNARFMEKNHEMVIDSESHDHEKVRFISENNEWLVQLGLAGKDGKIYDKSQKKYRQIQKYLEVIDSLIEGRELHIPFRIADMGSGKGYLTFALYDYLTNVKKIRCQITGYELREDLVTKCYHVAINCGFVGLTFQQKSIKDIDVMNVDMVIALHACDTATDMAIAKGIQCGADIIITAPCCHAQIRQSMTHQNELSPILKNGILESRQAEILTDGIRALLLQSNGYKSKVFEFISPESTSKNIMITGVKTDHKMDVSAEIDSLKKYFGISSHYLEELLDGRASMKDNDFCGHISK